MKRALLGLLGALVVLLGNTAGAAELVGWNFKRYLTMEFFKALSDDQAYDWLSAADGNILVENIVVQRNGRRITFNAPAAQVHWPNFYMQYPNMNIIEWLEFNDDYRPHVEKFNYSNLGEWMPDGYCFYSPGTKVKGFEFTSLTKIEFESHSKNSPGGVRYNARTRWGTGQSLMGSGETYYTSDHKRDADIWLGACWQTSKITEYVFLPYGPYMTRADGKVFLGNALRGSALAYYENTQVPNYTGFTYEGYTESELVAECTEVLCPGYGGGSTGTNPGAGGSTGGTTTPPCTRSDGTTSGNPYDCAPTDNETSCSIINLPCNFKKAFIPRDNFLQYEVPKIFSKQWNLPTQVVDEITVNLPIYGKVGLNFAGLTMNSTFQGMLKLMAAFASLFWLLNFFGIPNILGNARGSSDIPESVYKAGRMAHRVNKRNGRVK